MMYMMTEQEHAQIVEALTYCEALNSSVEQQKLAALAMLKAMQPVSHPKTETPLEANVHAGSLSQRERMLLEALKHHMEQTRPIQRSIDAIKLAEGATL
jgi:hypothetical protein